MRRREGGFVVPQKMIAIKASNINNIKLYNTLSFFCSVRGDNISKPDDS